MHHILVATFSLTLGQWQAKANIYHGTTIGIILYTTATGALKHAIDQKEHHTVTFFKQELRRWDGGLTWVIL